MFFLMFISRGARRIIRAFGRFQIDVNSSLEKQGPLHVFLHKLTDTQSHAESGDKNVRKCFRVTSRRASLDVNNYITRHSQAGDIVSRLQEYIAKHPDLIVIDSLDNIRNLRNRCKSYEFIQKGIRSSGEFAIYHIVLNRIAEEQWILTRY